MRIMLCLCMLIVLGLPATPAQADWADWWRTPEQQARAALEAGDVEQLKRVAPDAAWQGVAEHESGDFESAGRTFGSVAQEQQLEGNIDAANRALYNQGVSEVRAGQYDKAVQTFDRVLEQDPQFDDARHNRDIAQQLIQQQEQQQQQPDDGEGDSSQEGEQQSSDESGDSSSDSQSGEQGEPGEQSESEQGDAGEQSGDSDETEESQAQSQAQQAEDEQAARDALEAEAQAGNEIDDETDGQERNNAAGQEQPMSESDQATEQWLRRIPDDPAGLLRRKLEQSHRTDYPQVRDSREPW